MITKLDDFRIESIGKEDMYFNCDCMDLLNLLPDNSIDLAVVDPPYGAGSGSSLIACNKTGHHFILGRKFMTAKDFFNDYLNKRFNYLAQEAGEELALFYCCAVADVVFDFAEYKGGDEWQDYVARIGDRRFADRDRDIGDIAKITVSDRQKWIAAWGKGAPENPYTEDDYRYMDELFKTYSARSLAAGNFDAQVEFNLRTVCKQQLLADKSLAKGTKEGVDISTKLTQNILKILESENLRAKDAESTQGVNIDDIENVIQKKYGIGLELTRDQALQIFYDWQRSRHYPVTIDAVEEIIKIIVNCTRANNDMLPIDKLPPEAKKRLHQIEEGVFESEPDYVEDEVFRYLNLERETDDGEE